MMHTGSRLHVLSRLLFTNSPSSNMPPQKSAPGRVTTSQKACNAANINFTGCTSSQFTQALLGNTNHHKLGCAVGLAKLMLDNLYLTFTIQKDIYICKKPPPMQLSGKHLDKKWH